MSDDLILAEPAVADAAPETATIAADSGADDLATIAEFEKLTGEELPESPTQNVGEGVKTKEQAATAKPFVPAAKPASSPSPKTPFSYSDDDERRLFSPMSNESRAKLLPIYRSHMAGETVPKKDLVALQTKLDTLEKDGKFQTWNDHPEGYVLTEGFSTLYNKATEDQAVPSYDAMRRAGTAPTAVKTPAT